MSIQSEVAEQIELARNEAWANIHAAAPLGLASELGLQSVRLGSALALVVARLNHPMLNHVLGLGITQAAAEETVDAVCQLYQGVGITAYEVILSPNASPPDLTKWLEARGLQRRGEGAKLYRRTEPPPLIPTDLRVEEIGVEHAADFAAVFVEAFQLPKALLKWAQTLVGRPNWHHFLAFDGERAVACGSLFLRSRIGWLGNDGTVPSHRQRGAQGAIIAERIRAGARVRCEWLTSETGLDTPERPNHSYCNMVRNGFSLAYSPLVLQSKVSVG